MVRLVVAGLTNEQHNVELNIAMTNNMNNKNNEERRKFEYIYSTYSGSIYNFVMRMTSGNKYLAEEITQVTFVKLWEKLGTLNNEAAMLSYMFTIARNLFLNKCERETIEYVYYNYILRYSTEQDNTTERHLNEVFLNDFLLKVINELPPQQKKVFSLSKIEGRSNKEIAEEMRLSTNTVERHMSLALRHIRSKLVKYYNVLVPIAISVTAILHI